jgi:predicted AlkP superfamily phosphohydrolase/phosphomutase
MPRLYGVRRAALAGGSLLFFLLAFKAQAHAYTGPGAGFALVTSFLVVGAALFLALLTLGAWPFRLLFRLISGRRAFSRSRVRRVVIVGLDGLDPRTCGKLIAEGKLPHLARLHFLPLATTNPPLSPVAWSTFQTGMDPSYHGLFDFLRPARPSYSAELSSVKISPPRRVLRLGRLRLPLGRPRLRLRRHGTPFWQLLGRRGIFSAIIRVPISFPPERFHGVSLSAMCVPDLRGTQGSFTFFSSENGGGEKCEGGLRAPVKLEGRRVVAELVGPRDPLVAGRRPLRLEFTVTPDSGGERALLVIGGRKVPLVKGRHSDWVPVAFRSGLGLKIQGLVRFCLIECAPHFKLYASPLHLDPERPALPISHPKAYAAYLARRFGRFATLGLAEETWALNERLIDEDIFLEGTYRIHEEREAMLFDALDKVRRGLVVCVFDASDRIQHMFLRTLHPDHPANRDKEVERHRDVIETMYGRMDDLVGRVRARLAPNDALLVISDHGFRPFKRGINLNAWLRQEGLLHLQAESAGGPWFQGVDWERTKAYGLGLSGIYINRRGREGKGIAGAEEARQIKSAIRRALESLSDPAAAGAKPVSRVFDAEEIYQGPYRDECPDLIVGYGDGYRVAWSGATGHTEGEVFEDNTRSWSGDHCVDPRLVPGVLFSSLPIQASEAGLADLAPTVLDLFGVDIPPSLKGKALLREAVA